MKRFYQWAWMVSAAGVISTCAGQDPSGPSTLVQSSKNVGFDVSFIDASVKPQVDFYQYAIGNWRKSNPIPKDKTKWAAFSELREQTSENLKKTILKAAEMEGAAADSVEHKVGTFYKVAMDEAKIEADGLSPIREELDRIDNIKTRDDLVAELAHMFMNTANPLFRLYVVPDDKNTSMNLVHLYQGGLGLPDRSYYLEKDDRSKEIRARYIEHLTNMCKLIGSNNARAKKEARFVMALETRLAKASNTRTQNRDPVALYNKMSPAKLAAHTPKFDWKRLFRELGVNDPGPVVVRQPKFIKEVGKMVGAVPINKWKAYLRWHLVRSMAPALSSDVVNERFAFASQFLKGQEVIAPRWKRVVKMTNRSLGEAVGQLYVKDHFPPEAKRMANEIVDNLMVAMGERIDTLAWMSQPTKVKAREKLSTMTAKIGYPDKWKDLTKLVVETDSYAKNVMRAKRFKFDFDAAKINQPVDKSEWFIPPQTVNAVYETTMNDITFPAGILQFPFFDRDVDEAINYGAMGAVIGHEITHGFDDQGRQFDKDGNLNDWWTGEDAKKFNQRAELLVEQFNAYSPYEAYNVNGKMTLGENIADLGGLTVAYQAFQKTAQYNSGEKIGGFTPTQRFFLSWAQIWKCNIREDALKTRIRTDTHSPAHYRVVGPLSNLEPFFEAFEIKPGDPMRRNADQIVEIW